MKSRFVLVVAAVVLTLAQSASADLLSLTSGPTSFQWNPDDGTNSLSTAYDSNISFSFLPLLRYRNPNGTLNTFEMADATFGTIQQDVITSSASSSGNTGSQNAVFGYREGLGGVQSLLTVDMDFSLTTNVFGNPQLEYSMSVTNVSGVNRSDVELFLYFDWDLIDNQNTVEDYSLDGYDGFLQRASALAPFNNAFHGTDNLQNWEVAPWDSIETKLLGGGSLTNSGTPFAVADATGAFGWNLGTMTAGQNFSVNMYISSIPEPGSAIFLAAGLLGCCGVRRRRFAS